MRTTRIWVLVAALSSAGCSSWLSTQIVESPNHGRSAESLRASRPDSLRWLGVDRVMHVDVDPPAATLEVWVVEPRTTEAESTDGRAVAREAANPRGTILVLHGVSDSPLWMLGKAKDLADLGYRSVLVASRGNGGSSGDYRTFGVVERRDLAHVLDALGRDGLLAGEVGVLGMSYGAAVAIQFAGSDPRVRAVVAIAGFSSMRDIAPHYMKTLVPITGFGRDDADFQSLVDEAGRLAAFDPDQASAVDAMSRTRAAVLVVHGTWDALVPFENAQRIMNHANERSMLMRLEGAGHIGAWLDVDGRVADATAEWLDRWLGMGRASSPRG